MVVVALVLGLAGGAGAVVFRLLIRLFQGLFFAGPSGVGAVLDAGLLADPSDPIDAARALGWLAVLPPLLGGLVVGPLIYFFAREARGPGVPEVMKAVALQGGVIHRRVVAIKTLASAITIGSGGSVGREGPIVQIGAAIASSVGQALRVPPRQLRTMVGCGAAAGIAATFNAPIAGALFAVEIIIGDFAVAQFSPIVIASVVATIVSRGLLGNHPAFAVPTYELVSPFELFLYMGVGVLAGLVGLAFMRLLVLSEDTFEAVPVPPYLKAGLGGLCVGALALAVPQVLGVGYSTIDLALVGELSVEFLAVLLVVKLVATSITVGSGGSGGVFAPSLFLGAMTGALAGALVHQAFPDSTATSGAYALVTMGAMVAATTQAPITAIIMIFELTQSIEIIPPLMAACVVSTLVTSFLQRDSIYTLRLRRQGIDLDTDREGNVLKTLYVRELVDREPEVLPASARFDEVIDRIVQSEHQELYVVNDANELIGAIYLDQVRRLLKEQQELRAIVVAGDMVERAVRVSENADLDAAMQLFSRAGITEVAVVSPDDPRQLVGTLHEHDVIAAYNNEILRRDLAGGVSNRISLAGGERAVELGGHYVLQELAPPHEFVGRSLRELNLRARGGVQVLLIRSPADAGGLRVPGPDDRIGTGDRLVVAGPRDAVDQIDRV